MTNELKPFDVTKSITTFYENEKYWKCSFENYHPQSGVEGKHNNKWVGKGRKLSITNKSISLFEKESTCEGVSFV